MTKKEQRTFIIELIRNVKADILSAEQLGQIPKDWDGLELRWFISEKFNEIVLDRYQDKGHSRYREYANTVLVENL